MATLRKRNTTPPGGFNYKQRETGLWIHSHHLEGLVMKVIAHRKQKNLEPIVYDEVQFEVETQICSYQTPRVCRPDNSETWDPTEDRTAGIDRGKIRAATSAMLSFIKDMSLVDESELARRQEICKGCYMNKGAKGCLCKPVYQMVDSLIPEDRKSEDLQVCGACGCALNAKVQVKEQVILDTHDESIKYPELCWQREIIENGKEKSN